MLFRSVWQHVQVGMNFGGKDSETYNANLILSDDKTDGPQLIDPQGYIKDFTATTTTDSTFVYTTFTFTAAKAMPDTNMMVSAWDSYKRANIVRVHGAIQFGPDTPEKVQSLPAGVIRFDDWSALYNKITSDGFDKARLLGHI